MKNEVCIIQSEYETHYKNLCEKINESKALKDFKKEFSSTKNYNSYYFVIIDFNEKIIWGVGRDEFSKKFSEAASSVDRIRDWKEHMNTKTDDIFDCPSLNLLKIRLKLNIEFTDERVSYYSRIKKPPSNKLIKKIFSKVFNKIRNYEKELIIDESNDLEYFIHKTLSDNLTDYKRINELEKKLLRERDTYKSLDLVDEFNKQKEIIKLNKELIEIRVDKLSYIYEKIYDVNYNFRRNDDKINTVKNITNELKELTRENVSKHQEFIGKIENLEINGEYLKEMKYFSSEIASTNILNSLLILTEENLMNLNDVKDIKELYSEFMIEKNKALQIIETT